jgi:indolepyruvate ferredoxin oxidoreductase, beta subunit
VSIQHNIILAGVGGQGILSIAAVIGMAAMDSGLHVKQAEVHGMSQRGGAVQSHLRLSDKSIASDLIPEGECDLILSVEPMEALRYLPFLSPGGWLVTSGTPFRNIDDYPPEEELYEEIRKTGNHLIVDASGIASGLGSSRVSNMVMLGAASALIRITPAKLEGAVEKIFGRKGEELVRINREALRAGREGVRKQISL